MFSLEIVGQSLNAAYYRVDGYFFIYRGCFKRAVGDKCHNRGNVCYDSVGLVVRNYKRHFFDVSYYVIEFAVKRFACKIFERYAVVKFAEPRKRSVGYFADLGCGFERLDYTVHVGCDSAYERVAVELGRLDRAVCKFFCKFGDCVDLFVADCLCRFNDIGNGVDYIIEFERERRIFNLDEFCVVIQRFKFFVYGGEHGMFSLELIGYGLNFFNGFVDGYVLIYRGRFNRAVGDKS